MVIKKTRSRSSPRMEGISPYQCTGGHEEEDPAPILETSCPSTFTTDQSLLDWLEMTLLSALLQWFLCRYSCSSFWQIRGSKEDLAQPIPGCTKEPLDFQYANRIFVFTGPGGGEKLVVAVEKYYVETFLVNTINIDQNFFLWPIQTSQNYCPKSPIKPRN